MERVEYPKKKGEDWQVVDGGDGETSGCLEKAGPRAQDEEEKVVDEGGGKEKDCRCQMAAVGSGDHAVLSQGKVSRRG